MEIPRPSLNASDIEGARASLNASDQAELLARNLNDAARYESKVDDERTRLQDGTRLRESNEGFAMMGQDASMNMEEFVVPEDIVGGLEPELGESLKMFRENFLLGVHGV